MPPPSREPDHASLNVASAPPSPPKDAPAIAVSATFTAEPLDPTLAFWLRELGLEYQIRFAPYNQVFQQLLDPSSLLAHNRNEMCDYSLAGIPNRLAAEGEDPPRRVAAIWNVCGIRKT